MDSALIVLQTLLAGFPVLLLHFAVTLVLWLLTLTLYYRLTPHNELQLIREGNVATAISSGGVAMGLALPLAACLAGSVGIWDIIIWSVPILAVQFFTFLILNRILGDMPYRLQHNDIAAATYLFMVRMGSSFLVTAAIAS